MTCHVFAQIYKIYEYMDSIEYMTMLLMSIQM